MNTRRGFTIIELLVTIGLILLLASLIIVALRGVLQSAKRADTSSALRQMTAAYSVYVGDHNQALMPGYASVAKVQALGLNPRLGDGTFLLNHSPSVSLGSNDASSYVWRLAPYMDNTWESFFVDYRSSELNSRLSNEMIANIYGPTTAAPSGAMGISLIPSIGLNSIYLGGDDVHGSSEIRALNPWDNPSGKVAATRMTEVKNPRRIILFAATRYFDQDDLYTEHGFSSFPSPAPLSEVQWGYSELRPPVIQTGVSPADDILQWSLSFVSGVPVIDWEAEHFNATGGGLPAGRWSGRRQMPKVPVSHLDGSVTTEELGVLAIDRSFWNPTEAVGADR